jgi:hypothetical protein
MSEPAAPPSDAAIFAMTPEQATEALAQMAKRTPGPPEKSPAAARQELSAKMNDPAWRGRYESGSLETRAEFERLVERGKPQIDEIIAGTAPVSEFETVTGGQLGTRQAMLEAGRLKDAGIAPDAIKELLEGAAVPAELYDQVEKIRAEKFRDAEWRNRLFRVDANGNPDPDPVAQRELLLLSMVRVQGRARGT